MKEDWHEPLGGAEGIRRWVDRFYDLISQDELLSPLFPKDLKRPKEKQGAFFIEFFLDDAVYTRQYGKPFLRYKHRHVKIGLPERDRWLELVMKSLAVELTDEEWLSKVKARLTPIADVMVNYNPDKKDAYYFN